MSATEIELGSTSDRDAAAVGDCNTPRERMLLQPQNYIGSVEKCTRNLWVVDGDSFRRRSVTYIPGLYKIFDDVLVYAAENKQHDPSMNSLKVDIDVAECRISIYYNGQGVPIELHPESGIYMPEMVFGDLSHNEETAGGRNSNGVKLANLFSTEFAIEIVDNRLKRKYKQIFSQNMGTKSEPEMTVSLLGVSSTRITFKPDFAKFDMTRLDNDVMALMKKRVFDMVAFLDMTVKVRFNGQMIQRPKRFSHYVFAYLQTAPEGRKFGVCQKFNDQLEVFVTRSNGTFEQVSFANKFATTGGSHVDFVSDQLMNRLVKICSEIFQVEQRDIESEIKRHLWVFVNATIDNPTFSSPTRDALTTPQESFSSSCELTDLFLSHVFQCIAGELISWSRKASKRSAQRKTSV